MPETCMCVWLETCMYMHVHACTCAGVPEIACKKSETRLHPLTGALDALLLEPPQKVVALRAGGGFPCRPHLKVVAVRFCTVSKK